MAKAGRMELEKLTSDHKKAWGLGHQAGQEWGLVMFLIRTENILQR